MKNWLFVAVLSILLGLPRAMASEGAESEVCNRSTYGVASVIGLGFCQSRNLVERPLPSSDVGVWRLGDEVVPQLGSQRAA